MKKSVILTIAVIYILAIVVVGFMGIRMQVYEEKVYVDEIVMLTEGYKPYTKDTALGESKLNEGIDGYITKSFKEGLKVELKCQVKPDNADNKNLLFSCDASDDYKLVMNSDGTATIEFYKGCVATVLIKSADGKGANMTVEIKVNDFIDL